MKEKVSAELKNSFRPEFLNRIDATVVFRSLTVDEIREIVDIQLKRVRDQLKAQSMSLEVTQAAKDQLIKLGWDPAFGARPLKRAVQNLVEDPIAERLLDGEIAERAVLRLSVVDGRLALDDVAVEDENPIGFKAPERSPIGFALSGNPVSVH
jgi:ATP-dependent Clp protease ATP-binding subunit ClpB